jgi:uncharacterized membrane protein YphA (DoxX/SURF4 family)
MNSASFASRSPIAGRESRRRWRMQTLSAALRIIIGGIFFLSGLLKLINQAEFTEALKAYGFLPALVVEITALLIPYVELVLGLCFALAIRTRLTGGALAGLLLLFTIAGAMASINGQGADCGCFPLRGVKTEIGPGFFIRNIFLMLSCVWALAMLRESNGAIKNLTGTAAESGIRFTRSSADSNCAEN